MTDISAIGPKELKEPRSLLHIGTVHMYSTCTQRL